jgi:hypothetical protein
MSDTDIDFDEYPDRNDDIDTDFNAIFFTGIALGLGLAGLVYVFFG